MFAKHISRVALLFVLAQCLSAAADPVESLRNWLEKPADQRESFYQQPFINESLTCEQVDEATKLLVEDHLAIIRATRSQEWNDKLITLGDKKMKWLSKTFGEKPKDGHSLLISMHGGGGAPPEVNEQQWQNQIRLYEPKEAIVIAPRAPTDNWNLWHEAHIDPMFDRLIEDAIAIEGVNPDRIYLTGYSAGGDGTYQLAPRMADRFAGAAMNAGHPNEASPLGLRNLPFAIHVGALDDAFNRNKVAEQWGKQLDELQKNDPEGYVHQWRLHEGRAHWMNREERAAIDWMLTFTRNPYPKKVVWKQDDVTHTRFYWLAVPVDAARQGAEVVASISGQTITIEKADGVSKLTILLNDTLVSLDQPVTVMSGGKTLFAGSVKRSIANIEATLEDRCDPAIVFTAAIPIEVK